MSLKVESSGFGDWESIFKVKYASFVKSIKRKPNVIILDFKYKYNSGNYKEMISKLENSDKWILTYMVDLGTDFILAVSDYKMEKDSLPF